MRTPQTFSSVPRRIKIERVYFCKCCFSFLVIDRLLLVENLAERHGKVHFQEIRTRLEIPKDFTKPFWRSEWG